MVFLYATMSMIAQQGRRFQRFCPSREPTTPDESGGRLMQEEPPRVDEKDEARLCEAIGYGTRAGVQPAPGPMSLGFLCVMRHGVSHSSEMPGGCDTVLVL